MAKFLDENGLSYLWGKIKQYVDDHSSSSGGDMSKNVYDTNSMEIDIFQYADELQGKTTEFLEDGSIKEIATNWTKLTIFNTDGSITERLTYKNGKWIEKTTVFDAVGSISETLLEGQS